VPTHAQPLRVRIPRIPGLLVVLLASLLLGATATTASATAAPGQAAVTEASHHNGKPYAYGATGPSRFDCSGFTMYVFSRFGKKLPHNSAQQYNAAGVAHITKANKMPGDIIFLRSSSGSINHVGIYAGNGKMWDAPKSGDHVRLRAIYSSNYVVGRVR
jgi:cell wall-associated NlpC family hydrolase